METFSAVPVGADEFVPGMGLEVARQVDLLTEVHITVRAVELKNTTIGQKIANYSRHRYATICQKCNKPKQMKSKFKT